MKILVAIPLLVGALLFSGCEATVVDGRPHRYYGRSDRDYYTRSHSPTYRGSSSYYRSRSGYYPDRSGYYRSNSTYGRTREIDRVTVVTPRGHSSYTTVKKAPYKKKHDDHDHR